MTAPSVTTDLIAHNLNFDSPGILKQFDIPEADLLGQSFMHELAREDDVLSAEAIMEGGTSIDRPDDTGRRPLHEAAFFGSIEMVKFLTHNGALMDAPIAPLGYTALYLAVQQGHLETAKCLVALGARLSVEDRLTGQGLLHVAAARGDMQMTGLLIAAGVDVFQEDKKGQTARDFAAKHNHKELESVLLKIMQHHAMH